MGVASAERRGLEALKSAYPEHEVVLTASGTAALALGLQVSHAADGVRPVVALPAYGCPDLGAAALFVGANVILYDLDPCSLEPDEASLRGVLSQGVTHLVLTHLFGRVVDVTRWLNLARGSNVTVIEDAAQHAGGRWGERRAGGLADLGVLSFGRGKGLNAAGGGALLMRRTSAARDTRLPSLTAAPRWRGLLDLARASATDVLSEPTLYGYVRLNSALAIGSTRFHRLSAIAAPSGVVMDLVAAALAHEADELKHRRDLATWYNEALAEYPLVQLSPLAPECKHGALRYPFLWPDTHAGQTLEELLESAGLAALGVVRSYPRTLACYPEIARHLQRPDVDLPGSNVLASRLCTLPTHRDIDGRARIQIRDRLTRALNTDVAGR